MSLCNPECTSQLDIKQELLENVDVIKFKENIIKNYKIVVNIFDQAFSFNNKTVKIELKGKNND